MVAVVMGIAAVLLAALLVVAVDAAGGWRRIRPATAADEAQARPAAGGTGLDWRGWRIRTVANVLQLALVVALGLTPLGARFVHLVAPKGDTWHDAAAWLLILGAVAAVAGLPVLWWQRKMRRTAPELFRPRGGPELRLARAAMVAAGLLNLVLWVFLLVLDIRRDTGADAGLLLALAVSTWLLVLSRRMRIRRLAPSDRLSDMVSSLPGAPRIPVVSGWLGAVANVRVIGRRRPVIVIDPPIAAALTDRELRAALAHEVAHVRHGDARRRVLRRLLVRFCALAAAAALYGIPALRSLAGLRGGLSVQAGPFLLAIWYLVFRVLHAMELRATRAEEIAADRDMVSLTGDPEACADGLGKLSSLLGTPDAWTLPQRLLFATHPATSERLRLLRDPAPVADVQSAQVQPAQVQPAQVQPADVQPADVQSAEVQSAEVRPRATSAHRAAWRSVLAGVLVLSAVVAIGAASGHSGHRVIAMPSDAGKYRVLLPRSFDTAPMETAAAKQLRSSVWGSGDLTRFPGAVPVAAVYDQDGETWFYAWGAYGKLADPSGELSAFWNKVNAASGGFDIVFPDAESSGPLGGYLQCDGGSLTCAWADNSGIVVVSVAGPAQLGDPVITYEGPEVTEQQLAAITLLLRAAAEVAAPRGHTASSQP
jgi:Zn-dependent protease with chaperone function